MFLKNLWSNQPNRWSIAFEFSVIALISMTAVGVAAGFSSYWVVSSRLTSLQIEGILTTDQVFSTLNTLRLSLTSTVAFALLVAYALVFATYRRSSFWLDKVIRYLGNLMNEAQPFQIPGEIKSEDLGSQSEVFKLVAIANRLHTDLEDIRLQVSAIAAGELESDTLERNVSGTLGQSFRHMVVQLKELSLIARAISKEQLSHPLLDRERKGTFASAHQELIKRLRLLIKQADAIAKGQLSNPILDEGGEGDLSQMFQKMTRNLRLLGRQTDSVSHKDMTGAALQEILPGEMGDSLSHMFRVLEDMVKVSQRTIVRLATSSRELAALSTSQKEMANDQAETTNKTSTTFQELSVSAAHVVNNVEQVLQAATRMVQGCQETQERSQAMLTILEETISVGEENLTRVKRLEESSRKIVGVTAIISELANETRVLGVNAAIMAAQAGENAGGFTVVAREIRRLATKTVGATKEIKDYVLGIQKSILDVVKSTSTVQDRSREGGFKARESTQTMQELLVISNQVAEASQSISSNIKEQQTTIEDVLGAVRNMDENASSFSMTASEIHNLASHLRDSSEELHGLIGEYKV